MVDEVAWMRHQHVGGKPAVGVDAEMARRRADVLLAAPAGGALAAADPWIDRDRRARRDPLRGLAEALDDAGDLVAEREGKRPAGPHVELLVVARQAITVLHVQVGRADAAARGADPR